MSRFYENIYYRIFILFYTIRNKLFPIDTGPSSVMCVNDDYYRGSYPSLTKGKIYQSERCDRVSYYLKDNNGSLCEVSRTKFKDIGKERSDKLKKLGI